jgi:hypothetical protein
MKLQRGVRKDYGVQREQRQFLERLRHPYQIVRRFPFPILDKGALSYYSEVDLQGVSWSSKNDE